MIIRMPALPRRADRRGGHLIVCGDGPLAYRITEELTSRYGERVTVILPSRRHNHGPQISALPRVRVLEHPELSTQAFTDADVQSARADRTSASVKAGVDSSGYSRTRTWDSALICGP